MDVLIHEEISLPRKFVRTWRPSFANYVLAIPEQFEGFRCKELGYSFHGLEVPIY
jgi:hypothetical protein